MYDLALVTFSPDISKVKNIIEIHIFLYSLPTVKK